MHRVEEPEEWDEHDLGWVEHAGDDGDEQRAEPRNGNLAKT